MSEHPAPRSSVGSRSSVLPHHHQRFPPAPDPLASVWIRRLHLTPNPLPPPPPPPPPPRPPPLHIRAPPPAHQDAISTDESRTPPPRLPPRSTGFGPFRWSPRPSLGAPAGAWDAAAAASIGDAAGGSAVGGGQTMLSPFFRLPAPLPPVADFEDVMPLRPLIGLGSHSGSGGFPGLSRQMVGGGQTMLSPFFRLPAPLPPVADFEDGMPLRPLIGLGSHSGSGGFPGLSRQMVGGGDPGHAWLSRQMVGSGDPGHAWLSARAAGAAYPSHALDMVPIRTLNDLHDRQHGAVPVQPNLARHDPSSSSQHDEPFSYWNMGRFRRNTTTSSIEPTGVAPVNLGTKRNADSTNFLPLKLRKLSGAI